VIAIAVEHARDIGSTAWSGITLKANSARSFELAYDSTILLPSAR